MDLYAENILDHYRHPRGKQQVVSDKWQIIHHESNPACGDEVTIGLNIKDNYIQNIHWDGTGCAISQAAMSMLSEGLDGKSLEEIDKLTKEEIFSLLGVPISPRRLKCALLGLHTLQNALHTYRKEPPQGWGETIRGAVDEI